jgi:hypothetical protein
MGISPSQGRYLHTGQHKQNKHTQTSMPPVGFEPTISVLVGRTPWTGDQPVARPLPTHRTTQTEYTHTNNYASSGIRTHDLSNGAS